LRFGFRIAVLIAAKNPAAPPPTIKTSYLFT
jgi:hypothetical protein